MVAIQLGNRSTEARPWGIGSKFRRGLVLTSVAVAPTAVYVGKRDVADFFAK
jgi:hypothetical protein